MEYKRKYEKSFHDGWNFELIIFYKNENKNPSYKERRIILFMLCNISLLTLRAKCCEPRILKITAK